MDILLWDKRVKPGEPGFEIPLGESTSVSLNRDRGLHILDIKTNLAYHLSISLTKAELGQLRSQLIEKTGSQKAQIGD